MYYILFLYLGILTVVPLKKFKNEKIIKLTFAVIPLILISAFRYGVGADYFSYNYIYEAVVHQPMSDVTALYPNIDVGFLYVYKFLSLFGLSFQGVITLLSAIQIIAVAIWVNRNSDNPMLSMLIYYAMFIFVWNFSALRQGLVITFSLLLFDRKKSLSLVQEVLLVLALYFIHSSALVLLFHVFAKRMNINKKTILILFIASLVLNLLPLHTLLQPFSSLPGISRILEYTEDSGIRMLVSFASIARIVLFSATYIFYDSITKEKEQRKIVNSYLLGFVLFFTLGFAPVASGRFASYYYFLIILILPMIVEEVDHFWKFDKKAFRNISMIGVVAFVTLSMYKEQSTLRDQTSYLGGGRLMPYTTVSNSGTQDFNVYYSDLVLHLNREMDRQKEFKTREQDIVQNYVPAAPGDEIISVWSDVEDNYILINQDGKRISDYKTFRRTAVYDQLVQMPEDINGFPVEAFRDINTRVMFGIQPLPDIKARYDEQNFEYPEIEELTAADLTPEIKAMFANESNINRVKKIHFTASKYNLYQIEYNTVFYSVYTSEEDVPFVDHTLTSKRRMDKATFIVAEGVTSREYYNKNNQLIWVEPLTK